MVWVYLVLHLAATSAFGAIIDKDNRLDYFETPKRWQKPLDATVALIKKEELEEKQDSYTLKSDSPDYKAYYGVCSDEKFVSQPVSADCTGFLVAKNRVATAGHCATSTQECRDLRFIFGYQSNKKGSVTSEFPKSQVYECQTLIKTSDDPDFAVIELDREVIGVTPFVRSKKTPKPGTAVAVTGFPHGLPLKLQTGGVTVEGGGFAGEGTIEALVSSFKGNSGSPLINEETLEVEGILVVGFGEWDESTEKGTSAKCLRPAVRQKTDAMPTWFTPVSLLLP